MSGINKNPILSICIPTWNRAKILDISLKNFLDQIKDVNLSELELYVSDNCSEDETEQVVKKYISQGLPITYNRNHENIGAARNFIKCMEWASGKYILLLGDDDIFKPRAIKYLLDIIRDKDYGLIHIHHYDNISKEICEYEKVEDFYKQVSFWFTFMSGCIFRKEVVQIVDSSKYVKTHLLQMPYYLLSATYANNLIVNKQLMETGIDSSNNGGYNFYEVFVKNYLNIWSELIDRNLLSLNAFEYIKKDIYIHFIIRFNYRLLVRHKNVMPEDKEFIGNRKGLKIAGAKEILEKYYGGYSYSRFSWVYYPFFFFGELKQFFLKLLKR